MDCTAIVSQQRAFFYTGTTLSYAYRIQALKQLDNALSHHQDDILAALHADLRKSDTEGYMTEIGVLKADLRYAMRHLRRWMRPQKVKTELMLFPASCYRKPEPFGVVLIMAPWNYPLLLCLEPLVGALAAGNCAVIKPSAYAPATSHVVAEIISECFPPAYCTVVEGGRAENIGLLRETFDYIFFTGSTTVGKQVLAAAAEHVTPVSLELGGKSPVIIDTSASLDLAAKRIVFGKFINAGQTCVAPDYVLVPTELKEPLVDRLQYWISRFYPQAEQVPGGIANYPRIVNEKHFDRLLGLMNAEVTRAPQGGTTAVLGGRYDRASLTIQPTLLPQASAQSPVMQEEIFGPLLPILTYERLDQVIAFIRERPKPLALYLFAEDKHVQQHVTQSLSFGGGCINDTLLHVATTQLPFGGVGYSGMGSYHGKQSFITFTHFKSIVNKGTRLDPGLRYRPYGRHFLPLLKRFL